MSETNSRTIETYNSHIQEYVENTPHEVTDLAEVWLDTIIEDLPKDSRILEIGSGIGHDAEYLEREGFTVERTDATPGFVELLKSRGYEARVLNVLKQRIIGSYALVLADAVLPHFTPDETKVVSENVFNSLVAGGKFACSLRIGVRDGWSDEKLGAPRYFYYWAQEDIETLLRKVGFSDIIATDGHLVNSSWLHLIAQKQ